MHRLRSMTIANLKMAFRARQALFWNLAFPLILLGLLGVVFSNGGSFSATVSVVGDGPVAAATGPHRRRHLEDRHRGRQARGAQDR
jgi:hypothetical protein